MIAVNKVFEDIVCLHPPRPAAQRGRIAREPVSPGMADREMLQAVNKPPTAEKQYFLH
jgi:hypothetical protein